MRNLKEVCGFLRPRRFGKSLFLSTLHYYYGIEHKNSFQELFGSYFIGIPRIPQQPQTLITF
ncbi:MAG: AAA family ATPase [Ignavibacteriales bacterium]|nr:AAA family ATPase [Ignavibacteriales bacterium]